MQRKTGRNTVFEDIYGSNRKQAQTKENYSNGDFYVGPFKNGQKHGMGVYTYEDGIKYEGFFKDGMKHGHGKVIHTNGKIIYVEYKNDKLVTNLYNDERDWDLNDDWRKNNTHFQGLAPTMIKSQYDQEFSNFQFENKQPERNLYTSRREKPLRVLSRKEQSIDNFINQQKNQDYFRTNHPSQQRSMIYNNSSVYGGIGESRRYQNSFVSRSIAISQDVYRSNFRDNRFYY